MTTSKLNTGQNLRTDLIEKKLTTSKINGFLKFDKVSYLGNEYFINGRSKTSPFRVMDIDGNEVTFESTSNTKYAKTRDLKRVSARSTTLCTKKSIADIV